MGKIIGIDLGTTNSVVAYLSGGKPEVIANAEGNRTTPSIVAVDEKEQTLVGGPAKNQAVTNPENTIYSVKRLIGRRWEDSEVQKDKELLPFEMKKADSGGVLVKMGDDWFTPQEISAKILAKLKKDAEDFLGEDVKEAVITVPAYFDDAQRKATKDAGKIAGLEVKRVINEPTAAALAYGIDDDKDEVIAVYDLGGGTFDVSILEIGDGVFEVLSTNGDTHLGGDSYDQRVIDYLADEFKKEHGINLREDKTALQRLKEAAEKAKIELSTSETTEVNVPYITADENGPKNLKQELTRAKFEDLISDLNKKTIDPMKKALDDAGLSKGDIDQVLLVGGMTRVPSVQKVVKEFFGKDPNKGVNPDEVVAVGAAIQGGVLAGDTSVKDITLVDVTPLSLGLETRGGVMTKLIDRNTTIPVEKTETFSTAVNNQPAVDIHVLQGERDMAADNKTLGKFILDGIPPAPQGVPQIEVTFKIDANGILNVQAVDKATGKEKDITIQASTGLSDDEIDKMVEEAAKNAEEDKKKREQAETRNQAESAVYAAKKLKDEHGDDIDEDKQKQLDERVEGLEMLLEKEDTDIEDLKSKAEELEKFTSEIGAEMYQKASEAAQAETAEGSGEGEEEGKSDSKDDKKAKDAKEGEVVDEDK